MLKRCMKCEVAFTMKIKHCLIDGRVYKSKIIVMRNIFHFLTSRQSQIYQWELDS